LIGVWVSSQWESKAMSDIKYTAVLPEGWERARGYAHAVSSEGTRVVRIAGQLAAENGKLPVKPGLDIGAQWKIALSNVVTLVNSAGGGVENIVSLRVFITSMAEFHQCGAAIGQAWKEVLGRHFPAMTLVAISELVDSNAKVEIECEAVLP
jgi:enamine deaminase RidA (YjgF/YER057c/UK114 family)